MLKGLSAFIVAGTRSGCGKTSLALAIMAFLRKNGARVAPFKTGPDFIDPGFHSLACGRASHNLDSWMMPEERVREVFLQNAMGCDVAVIEGAMGLFDGASGTSELGSAAHMAKILGVPVVLVVDASSLGRSINALVKGYVEYDREIDFVGVIVNKAGSEKHKHIIRQALSELDLPFLAVIGRNPEIAVPSRHLGLVTAMEQQGVMGLIERLSNLVEAEDFRLRALVREASMCFGKKRGTIYGSVLEGDNSGIAGEDRGSVKIAVAMDRAFCFYYERNFDILKCLGAELCFFSPVEGEPMPRDAGGLYLGGGYPELYARELAANKTLVEQIREGVGIGLPVFAECGGFMFLGKGLELEGERFRWCGLYDSWFKIDRRLQALGYRQVRLKRPCLLGTKGISLRGHEFRYSSPDSPDDASGMFFEIRDAEMKLVPAPCFVYKNVFASYIHIHFDSNEEAAANFVERCRRYNRGDSKTEGHN